MTTHSAISDLVTYLNNTDFLQSAMQDSSRHPLFLNASRVNALYANIKLDSQFQPIVRLSDNTIEGHEAFLSVQTSNGVKSIGKMLSPQTLFFLPLEESGISYIDRLARTLHALNFLVQDVQGYLHLNVHPHHILAVQLNHGKVFEGILRQCGLQPAQIVLEVMEYAVQEKRKLSYAIDAWQEKGYRIAIDNFGRVHANIEKLIKLKPSLIKIDRAYLISLLSYPHLVPSLRSAIAAALNQGIDVIATGIETTEQLELVKSLGIELAQGYLLGLPNQYCASRVVPAVKTHYVHPLNSDYK